MCHLLWEYSLCLQLGVSSAPLHLDSVLVRALRLWECGSSRGFSFQPFWAEIQLGSICWDPAPLSCFLLSQEGLFPWVFLQMNPSEQEQDVSREVQVVKELLSECRKFGWLLGLGCAAPPQHHPHGHWDALQLSACPACWPSSCPAGTPPAPAPPPAQ